MEIGGLALESALYAFQKVLEHSGVGEGSRARWSWRAKCERADFLSPKPSVITKQRGPHLRQRALGAVGADGRGQRGGQRVGRLPGRSWRALTGCCLGSQVLPKLSSSIIHEIDSILGNKPYSKKDYRS